MNNNIAHELGKIAAQNMVKEAFAPMAALGNLGRYMPNVFQGGRFMQPLMGAGAGAGLGAVGGAVAAPEGNRIQGAMRGAAMGATMGAGGVMGRNYFRTGSALPSMGRSRAMDALYANPNTVHARGLNANAKMRHVPATNMPANQIRNVTMSDLGGNFSQGIRGVTAPTFNPNMGGRGANYLRSKFNVAPVNAETWGSKMMGDITPQMYARLVQGNMEKAFTYGAPVAALGLGAAAGSTAPTPPWYQQLISRLM